MSGDAVFCLLMAIACWGALALHAWLFHSWSRVLDKSVRERRQWLDDYQRVCREQDDRVDELRRAFGQETT